MKNSFGHMTSSMYVRTLYVVRGFGVSKLFVFYVPLQNIHHYINMTLAKQFKRFFPSCVHIVRRKLDSDGIVDQITGLVKFVGKIYYEKKKWTYSQYCITFRLIYEIFHSVVSISPNFIDAYNVCAHYYHGIRTLCFKQSLCCII